MHKDDSRKRESEHRLVQNLREQYELQQRLLEHLTAQQNALRTADMERLFAVSRREQHVVERMTRLEQERLGLIGILMADDRQSGEAANLRDVLPLLSDHARRDVEAMHDVLRERVRKASELSAIVRSASESLHQHIAGVVKSMQRVFSDAGVYERKGVISNGHRLASAIDVRS